MEVPDLAVPHLPVRQTHVASTRMNQSIGILPQQPIVNRLSRQRDGIGLGLSPVTPTIKNDQNKRFRTHVAPGFLISRFSLARSPHDEGDTSSGVNIYSSF